MKDKSIIVRWTVFNIIYITMMIFAFAYSVVWLQYLVAFIGWALALPSFLTLNTNVINHFAITTNSKRSVDAWVDNLLDMFITIMFYYNGWVLTSLVYAVSVVLYNRLWEKVETHRNINSSTT